MTETDATKRPLNMPDTFLPYLEKHRIYKLFKDMVQDLVISLPKDHLKHMKIFLNRHLHCSKDVDRVIILVSPELEIDVKKLAKEMIKNLGCFVITRRCVMDRYEKQTGGYVGFTKTQAAKHQSRLNGASLDRLRILLRRPDATVQQVCRSRQHSQEGCSTVHSAIQSHDKYVSGCLSPMLLSEVTKMMTSKDPVPQSGWLMFDHPCTLQEARCLQQDGVLPTVTLVLSPPPLAAPQTYNPLTPARTFFQQDFEGLKLAYKASLKEVYIEPEDDLEKVASKCFNAIRAAAAGAQGPGQGLHVVGAPGVYRVVLIGPRGSGRRTQGITTAKHFKLIYLSFDDLLKEAEVRNDEIGEKLRKFGSSVRLRADIIKRRLAQKDCIDHGWILIGYPATGEDFEYLDRMSTPPNRIIFLNTDWNVCKTRIMARGVDWCSGKEAAVGSGPKVVPLQAGFEKELDAELDAYFNENLAELRAAAGITAVEIDGNKSFGYYFTLFINS